jgi:hypothetical protein
MAQVSSRDHPPYEYEKTLEILCSYSISDLHDISLIEPTYGELIARWSFSPHVACQ